MSDPFNNIKRRNEEHDIQVCKDFILADRTGKWGKYRNNIARLFYKTAGRIAQRKEDMHGAYKDYETHARNIFIVNYGDGISKDMGNWFQMIKDEWKKASSKDLKESHKELEFYDRIKEKLTYYPMAWVMIAIDFERYINTVSFEKSNEWENVIGKLDQALLGEIVTVENFYDLPSQEDKEIMALFLNADQHPWIDHKTPIAYLCYHAASRIAHKREHRDGIYSNYLEHAANLYKAMRQGKNSRANAIEWLNDIAERYEKLQKEWANKKEYDKVIAFYDMNKRYFCRHPDVWLQIAYDTTKYRQFVEEDQTAELNAFETLRKSTNWSFKETEHLNFKAA